MKRAVLVAMSGGVDSSVAALLLKREGYDVTGVTMRLDPGVPPPPRGGLADSAREGPRAPEDAARTAELLGIPHFVVDLGDLFRREVVGRFAREYERGRTPNPCVRCNKVVKFGALLKTALDRGVPRLATGHYARVAFDSKSGRYRLLKAADVRKDQSYFLYALNQNQLGRILTPLGGLTKEEVREIARGEHLPVSEKAESQEICFVAGGDYRRFLEELRRAGPAYGGPAGGTDDSGPAPDDEGPILDGRGRTVGTHRGLYRYTIGQRKGLGIPTLSPLYVAALDAARNAVVVGPREEIFFDELAASGVNWIDGKPREPERVHAKIRSLHAAAPALLTPGPGASATLRFDAPQWAVTPGQSAVFYRGEAVLGGGVIERGWRSR